MPSVKPVLSRLGQGLAGKVQSMSVTPNTESHVAPLFASSRKVGHVFAGSLAVSSKVVMQQLRFLAGATLLLSAECPNPSIEGTSNIRLRLLSAAPHVKR